jgi:hypothetical protein
MIARYIYLVNPDCHFCQRNVPEQAVGEKVPRRQTRERPGHITTVSALPEVPPLDFPGRLRHNSRRRTSPSCRRRLEFKFGPLPEKTGSALHALTEAQIAERVERTLSAQSLEGLNWKG